MGEQFRLMGMMKSGLHRTKQPFPIEKIHEMTSSSEMVWPIQRWKIERMGDEMSKWRCRKNGRDNN